MDDIITEKQAREFLGVKSRNTLWVLRKQKGLPCIKLGGRLLFKKSSLQEFVETLEKAETKEPVLF